jgi:hypothetical protein
MNPAADELNLDAKFSGLEHQGIHYILYVEGLANTGMQNLIPWRTET